MVFSGSLSVVGSSLCGGGGMAMDGWVGLGGD